MSQVVTLGEFIIERQEDFKYASGELSRLISAIRLASKIVNREVNKAGLADDILGAVGSENVQGEEQQKLDVFADEKFIAALKARGEVCGVASEENETYIAFDDEQCKNGKYVVLIDPLDGSSNIDVNVSIELFSQFTAEFHPLVKRLPKKTSFNQVTSKLQQVCHFRFVDHVGVYHWKWRKRIYLRPFNRSFLSFSSIDANARNWSFVFHQRRKLPPFRCGNQTIH